MNVQRLASVVILLGFILSASVMAGENKKAKKLPEPESLAVKAAVNKVRDIFKKDYEKKGADEKIDLARRLLKEARNTDRKQAVDRYALYREAGLVAVSGGDAMTMEEALLGMEEEYDVNLIPVRANLLRDMVKAVDSPGRSRDLVSVALNFAQRAIAVDQYALAEEICELAAKNAKKLKEDDYAEAAKDQAKDAKRLALQYDKLQAMVEKLKADPKDTEANLRLGEFHCFLKEDWETGLPYLAKSSDTNLMALAQKELGGPNDPEIFLLLGDKYWEEAGKRKDYESKALHARAIKWYNDALPKLKGLDKTRVTQRLEEMEATGAPSELMRGAVLAMTFDKEDQSKKKGVVYFRDRSPAKNHGEAKDVLLGIGKFGRSALLQGRGQHIIVPNAKSLQHTGNLTIAVWVYVEDFDYGQMLLGKAYGGEGVIRVERNRRLLYMWGSSGNNEQPYETASSRAKDAFPVRTWVHAAVVRDMDNKKITWYIDGKESSSKDMEDVKAVKASEYPLLIGTGYLSSFCGMIDDLVIWNRLLSKNEIVEIMHKGIIGKVK